MGPDFWLPYDKGLKHFFFCLKNDYYIFVLYSLRNITKVLKTNNILKLNH